MPTSCPIVTKPAHANSSLASILYDYRAKPSEKEAIRRRLESLSRTQAIDFIEKSRGLLDPDSGYRINAMDSLHILQEREDLGKTFSRRILPILEEADKSFPAPLTNYYCDPGDSNADLRRFYLLLLRVAATAHLLTPARIDSQISMISRQSLDSTSRVFIAGKLVDITHSAEIVPTVEQLQRLLGNDIPEIRILAVDWFGLSSTPDIKDKVHFMKIALNTNPTQVKESAFRGLLKWRPSELYALRAAGDPVADACAAERANINIQSYCAMLIAK